MTQTRVRKNGDPPAVDRKTALVREGSFFERLGAALNAVPAVYDPLDNRIYDAGPRNRVMRMLDDRSQEVKALIRKLADRDLMKIYEEMPKSPVVAYEVWHQQMFVPRSLRVVVAGASFSPTEELIRAGRSSRRIRSEELSRALKLIASDDAVFYYIGAFATTGWDESCRQMLVGANHLVALCDVSDDAWRTYYAPDARWRTAMRMFDLATDDEKVESIRAFVKRHTFELLMDELSEDVVFDELGYPIPIIREAFEEIASEDRFVRLETGEVPYRLIRVYG